MNQQVSLFAIALGLSAFGMLAFADEDCYFPKKSGCGSGDDFCSSGALVCEKTWTKHEDNGCGQYGPLGNPRPGQCAELNNVIIGDCDDPTPTGYMTVGCNNGNGSCCYTDGFNNWQSNPGLLVKQPTGEDCCDLTVQ